MAMERALDTGGVTGGSGLNDRPARERQQTALRLSKLTRRELLVRPCPDRGSRELAGKAERLARLEGSASPSPAPTKMLMRLCWPRRISASTGGSALGHFHRQVMGCYPSAQHLGGERLNAAGQPEPCSPGWWGPTQQPAPSWLRLEQPGTSSSRPTEQPGTVLDGGAIPGDWWFSTAAARV